MVVASYAPHRDWQGQDLATLARQQHLAVLDLAVRIQENGGASMINFSMDEEEMRRIMQEPFVATASDGSAQIPSAETKPHPRSYGCFPRKIGRYAIELEVLPLPQAIRSATGLPADILGLPERGYLRPGCFADVVVFEPRQFRDRATFEDPHQYATGVCYLFVNGVITIDGGELLDVMPGRALRHESDADKS